MVGDICADLSKQSGALGTCCKYRPQTLSSTISVMSE